jgi:hypothetical protein
MTEIRDCWRRDLSLLSPQQRRSAGYALRLLSLPRDPIAGRLDANRLGLLWGMLQPLFEPRHLIDYLRPPQGVADIVHQDDDVVELLNSCDLADCAVEMLDTGDLSDYAPPADAPLTTSDDQVMLALGHALLEEEIMAFEADHDPWVMATMPSVYIVQRLRWLIRRGDPLTLARLDEANLERVPASPTLALLGASLHLDGPTLSVLDFLDEFIATPGLGQLLRRFDDFNSSRRHFPRLAAVLALPEAALRQVLAQEAPLRRLGLVEFATQTCGMQDFLRPSPLLREVLEAAPADDAALLALLIEPAPPAAWPLTAFPHLETPARLAGETLAAAVATRAVGVNALLYGPPGTGKTAFAEILAAALDRELVACPAAELLSPWHGETERNLAALFRDGDPRQTVLLLNEVDSFLTARQAARQAWERTQGNELLQQMERYPGIFIAATNLISGLDPAALRRFDFKLHFRALTPAQRRALFAREVLGDDQAAIPATLARPLDALPGLTPGDFAMVCRQRELLGEALTPEQSLRRLAGEWRMKQVDGREVA